MSAPEYTAVAIARGTNGRYQLIGEPLGTRLRRAREACGLTLRDVAERHRFDLEELTQLEAGERTFRVAQVGTLAMIYGIDSAPLVCDGLLELAWRYPYGLAYLGEITYQDPEGRYALAWRESGDEDLTAANGVATPAENDAV